MKFLSLARRTVSENRYLYWALVVFIFLAITWLFMGPSLTHINTVVLNTPGDHTSGIMYLSWVHPSTPIPGISLFTNFPFGESLRIPITASSQVLSVSHWALSKLGTVATGWNLLVLIGYMSNALLMFGFIKWLTKNSWAAFFCAYAITFTPYHVFASRGQIAGLYGSIFILAVWQFLALWRKPHLLKAISLGTILGISFYTDGYFILIGMVFLLAVWISSLLYGYRTKTLPAVKNQLVQLLVASVTAGVWLLPLLYINFTYASKIGSLLDNARGSIEANAQTYSAQLPMYGNPNSLIFIGFTVLTLGAIGAILAIRQKNKGEPLKSEQFIVWTLIAITLIALWFSLQPIVRVFGLPIIMPSKLIITITSAWRVFGRLYSLVSIGAITLAGLGLVALMHRYPTKRYVIAAGSTLLLILELGWYPYHFKVPTFNYASTPAVYTWLRNQEDVKAIAEYPLDEPPSGQYLADYYTFQQVSGKPMLNTFLPDSPQAPLRRSIVGINDPQTLPVLRALGISVVNTRATPIAGSTLDISRAVAQNDKLIKVTGFKHDDTIQTYRISPGSAANYALTIPGLLASDIQLTDQGTAQYRLINAGTLIASALPKTTAKNSVTASFTVSSTLLRNATLVQDGKTIWSGEIGTTAQKLMIQIKPSVPVHVFLQENSVDNAITVTQLQVTD